MARSARSTTNVVDLTWEQMKGLINYLTDGDVKKFLDNPRLRKDVTRAIKLALSKFNWSHGRYHMPIQYWSEIAPGVEMMRPDADSSDKDTDHVLIRVKCTENCLYSSRSTQANPSERLMG